MSASICQLTMVTVLPNARIYFQSLTQINSFKFYSINYYINISLSPNLQPNACIQFALRQINSFWFNRTALVTEVSSKAFPCWFAVTPHELSNTVFSSLDLNWLVLQTEQQFILSEMQSPFLLLVVWPQNNFVQLLRRWYRC